MVVLRAHHCLRRPSGGPAGGYCRSSADPVACGAPRASAAKDGCTFLACGAQHLLAATLWIHSFETVRRRPEGTWAVLRVAKFGVETEYEIQALATGACSILLLLLLLPYRVVTTSRCFLMDFPSYFFMQGGSRRRGSGS